MTLKINRLPTHWQVCEAELTIDFLDELRDVPCQAYGEEIVEMHRSDATQKPRQQEELGDIDFDDEIEF